MILISSPAPQWGHKTPLFLNAMNSILNIIFLPSSSLRA